MFPESEAVSTELAACTSHSSSTEQYEQQADIRALTLFFFKIVFITIVHSSKLYG